MKFGIIGAMQEEVELLIGMLVDREEHQIANGLFYTGQLEGRDVVLLQSGIGKVNAALTTSILIDRFSPDVVINTGSAGGLDTNLNVGDVVLAKQLTYGDADATAFGYSYGQVPQMPAFYEPEAELQSKVLALLKAISTDYQVVEGLILTNDSFIHRPDQREHLLAHFPNAQASEMEATAIAQTAFQFKIPSIVIRSLSDIAGKESSMTYEEFLPLAAENSARIVKTIVTELN
ncbi:5'-methylthioadenosine/adenosylhomocysteine nucleosidase [Brochothrix thermosphacta]|uniref:5'-methylthioadenosine/adenosylhomocysteine nucleosidase n=1 Tax=Brochothrix thermosphacta TaxID=2756 RepID=UPI000D10B59E|nr:5'-methylthioadenosine/adenosylhomocysteine nucleosidase [Brochothrix thermosphacta]SOC32362.1 methylthioadenosine / S-adenosylhomocysteine nucleosidase [Brochothrix thermosphacta]